MGNLQTIGAERVRGVVKSESRVFVWRSPSAGPPGLVWGGMLLAFLSMSGTCLAGSPGGGLADRAGTLLGAFWVLVVLLGALLIWEFLDRRASAEGPPLTGTGTGSPAAGVAEGEAPLEEEEDPFKALLKKTAAPEKEPAAPEPGGTPEELLPTRPPEPVAAPRLDDLEELSPFQRLAQIGTEEVGAIPPVPPEARVAAPPPAAAASGGGDWASLLSKVQSEEEPPAPSRPLSLKSPEEDPWKKLLGQTASTEAPGTQPPEVEEDPWKSLLTKTASEASAPAGPESKAASMPATPEPSAPPARIKLGTPPASTPPPPPSQDSPDTETGRPRSISLDLKREEGRTIPPPPQTEDE